jgi:hypothetical protein
MAGPAADLDQRGHPGAGQARFDALTGRRYGADQVVAGHERERGLVVVPAPAHLLLGEGDPGRLHPDHDLAGARDGNCAVPDLQPFRLHLARQDDLDESFGVHDDLHRICAELLAFAFVRGYNSTER